MRDIYEFVALHRQIRVSQHNWLILVNIDYVVVQIKDIFICQFLFWKAVAVPLCYEVVSYFDHSIVKIHMAIAKMEKLGLKSTNHIFDSKFGFKDACFSI